MRAYSIPGLCWVSALVLAVLSLPAAGQNFYIEDFTTTAYKDTLNTTAVWDTVAGRLELPPFQLTYLGSYDTAGDLADIVVSGDLAFIADGVSGLAIIDITDPSNPTLLGTYGTSDNTQGVWIHGDLAFMCDRNAGLHIIDVSNPAAPSLVGTYNTSGSCFDVEVAGDYAFVADYNEGLKVFDISNPALPSLAGSYDTPGNARSIDVEGNYAYVADRGGGGLQIIDISDPTLPTSAGSYNPGGDTWGVEVSGNVAYLGAASMGLVAVDITDPTNPALLSTTAAGSARRLNVAGDYVYVAGYSAVFVFDISDPSNPLLLESYTTPGIANCVAVAGEHTYVADGAVGGLQVLTCSHSAGPALVGSYNTPGYSYELCVSGDYAFVADGAYGLTIIDISDPLSPGLAGVYNTAGFAVDVCVSGDTAYVADYSEGLKVIDVSDPASPSLAGVYSVANYYWGVDVSGDYVFVADGNSGLRVIDVTDPTAPTQAGMYNTPGYSYDVCVSGDHVFLADGTSGLQIIDVSNPASPALAGSYNTPGDASGVYVSGDHAFVADNYYGLQVIDISDPTTPTLAGSYDAAGSSYGVYVTGNYAFLSKGSNGLAVIDISDPADPTLVATQDTPGFARGVGVSGDHAFVADGFDGLQVIQVFQREFDQSSNVGMSLTINPLDDTSAEVPMQVRLTATQTNGVSWMIAKDTGFWPIEPDGTWLDLSGDPGIALIWYSTHTWAEPGVNPAVTQLQIDWLYAGAVIDSIIDIPNDQGRQVSIHWTRSGFDFVGFISQILEYAIYRRIDPLLAPLAEDGGGGGREGSLAWPPGEWHYIMTVPARAEDTYATVVPTLADSTISEGMYYTTFFISALTVTPGIYYDSDPDSGYSVDNLDPMVPQGFAVAYNSGGGTDLVWEECPDTDFQYFRVYRGESEDFTPDDGNLVHMTTGTAWRDEVAEGYKYYYKITSVDFSGNESGATSPTSITGDDIPSVPGTFALYQNVPNPFNPVTTITFDLPRAVRVKLCVYNVKGELVSTIVDRHMTEGRKQVSWTAADNRGKAVSSGMYFYNLVAGEFVQTKKMVLLK